MRLSHDNMVMETCLAQNSTTTLSQGLLHC